MPLKRIGFKGDPDVWEALEAKAKEVGHSRNKLVGMILEAVTKMDRDEILNLIYFTKSPPAKTS